LEPEVSGDEYIDFCLEFCQKHQIDIFIPRKANVLISKNLGRFEALGVKVLVSPDFGLMEMLDNKAATYESIIQKGQLGDPIFSIPDYYIVNNLEEFKRAYKSLREKGHSVCFKPVEGEGANGFRVIKEEIDTIDQLFKGGSGRRIPYSYACEILSQQDTFPDLMVLEYLEGTEYSIDCVASPDQLFVAIPRMKGSGRVRELVDHHELIQIAHRFHQEYKLPYAFNIQVKYNKGIPKLLEVNARMSGGVHFSCLSGINIPYLAIKILLGEKIDLLKP
jgi:hypothetical protein